MDNFEQQRIEAEQRVRDMNRAYREKAGLQTNPKEQPQNKEPPKEVSAPKRRPAELLKMLKLDSLKSDPDRLLLLGLFLLLSSEEADEWLLYALLYIML